MERSSISGSQPSSERARKPQRRPLLTGATAVALSISSVTGQPACAGLENDVVFSEYTELASLAELVHRLYSPLSALHVEQEARPGSKLRGQTLDLTQEHYSIYVPDRHPSPAGAYSLLVFVPPWPRAEVPRQWVRVLDRHNMILVTAENSGNEAPTVKRREPLALLAAYNVMKQYNVDPQRVYVGGFSGGARTALRLALGYPDVFRGAWLNAGSDPIGTADVPLPPADLFKRFQQSSRLVYLTGERDEENLAGDMHSRRSLEKWCVFDVVTQTEPRVGHELADAFSLGRSLDALLAAQQTRSDELDACRNRIDREIDTQLQQVESAVQHGESTHAQDLLRKIDARFGGLAAPRSVDLAKRHAM